MKGLLDFLVEVEYEEKESAKKNFRTYEVIILIKTEKKINRTQVQERIRGIEGVTIVDSMESDRLDTASKKDSKYNLDLYRVKFMTNKRPEEKVEIMKRDILHSDPAKDSFKINGVVSASPDMKTIKKI